MKISCDGPITVCTHGQTYALRSGENEVPDEVGKYMIESVKGVTAVGGAAAPGTAAAPAERSGRG